MSWSVVFHWRAGHRHADDAQFGEEFPQARNEDLAAEDDDGRPQRPAADGAVRRQHQEAGGDQRLSAMGSSMRPMADCCDQARAR